MIEDLVFLHLGGQCPWHRWMKGQVEKAAKILDGTYSIIDMTEEPEYARRHRVFFPMMTIIKGETRLVAPLPAREMVRLYQEGVAPGRTTTKELKPQATANRIAVLNSENITHTCELCNYNTDDAKMSKLIWWESIKRDSKNDSFGLISYVGDIPVAAVESVPIDSVPYPLPSKDETGMFITCIYSLEQSEVDYRGQLLERLSEKLFEQGYERVQVISGRRTAYPNGPLSLFKGYGYAELVELDCVLLKEKEEEIVLLEKVLG